MMGLILRMQPQPSLAFLVSSFRVHDNDTKFFCYDHDTGLYLCTNFNYVDKFLFIDIVTGIILKSLKE